MTKRDLEDLEEEIKRRLLSCFLCGNVGAVPWRVSGRGTVATLLICKPCFEKHRLPEGRSEE
jgi:hypothetical protein